MAIASHFSRLCKNYPTLRLCSRHLALTPARLGFRARSTLAAPSTGGLGRAGSTLSQAIPSQVPSATAATAAEPTPRIVGWWLLGCSASVFAMVVVGGITRLTRSGLSMTDWQPQGKAMPRGEDEWEVEFERYKQFPEYQRLYAGTGMTLDDFKNIFFWEWTHRMAGRAIGLIFGVPLAAFAVFGKIPRSLAPTLCGLLLLGGSQGLVGWWMVKSGLEQDKIDEIADGVPRVSPYRLATHLTCAFTLFTILLHTALGVLQPRADATAAPLRQVHGRMRLLATLVGVTAVSGAFVAGMQAGLAFNTFPLMEGQIIPRGYMELEPLYRNFFESVPSVQLHHRALALTTLASVTAFWASVQRTPLPAQLRLATDALLVVAWSQVGLGVATLLNAVPVHLGSAHQAGALTLFSLVLFTLHSCRVPHAGRLLARISTK
ncbi:hypothetical protein AB1Y20_021927 [Prymnesium parvum]|uniref:Cytochrome c oxidase assembly protein COX15 n=1 Tax=Prymnesium parvum TaxID=97485 RepID=A0AB34JGW8_PRYPA